LRDLLLLVVMVALVGAVWRQSRQLARFESDLEAGQANRRIYSGLGNTMSVRSPYNTSGRAAEEIRGRSVEIYDHYVIVRSEDGGESQRGATVFPREQVVRISLLPAAQP
jgi:hypothetical protein